MTGARPFSRVLHAVTDFGHPSETFITDRMVELERHGWEAWVATRSVLCPDLIEFPPPERILEARRWADRARALVVSRQLRSWWLERPIASVRPSVIHAHFGWCALQALPAATRHGIPLVVGLHGYDVTVFPRYGLDPPQEAGLPSEPHYLSGLGEEPPVYDELFRKARHVLVVSRYLEQRLRELGYLRDIAVIPSGIRLDRFPYRGPRVGPANYRLLFVGRLVAYKGLDVLLHALRSVVESIPEARLEVIGDGPTRAENEQLADGLGIRDCVAFRGARSHDEVVQALLRSDVLVMPSRTTALGQAEGLGNVVKEALAVGLAVTASNNGGIPETIPPEDRRALLPEGDAEALASRLVQDWADRDSWNDRAVRGRQWVEEHFDWRLLAPQIARLYRDAAEA